MGNHGPKQVANAIGRSLFDIPENDIGVTCRTELGILTRGGLQLGFKTPDLNDNSFKDGSSNGNIRGKPRNMLRCTECLVWAGQPRLAKTSMKTFGPQNGGPDLMRMLAIGTVALCIHRTKAWSRRVCRTHWACRNTAGCNGLSSTIVMCLDCKGQCGYSKWYHSWAYFSSAMPDAWSQNPAETSQWPGQGNWPGILQT